MHACILLYLYYPFLLALVNIQNHFSPILEFYEPYSSTLVRTQLDTMYSYFIKQAPAIKGTEYSTNKGRPFIAMQ
jgi:hypothetical protein